MLQTNTHLYTKIVGTYMLDMYSKKIDATLTLYLARQVKTALKSVQVQSIQEVVQKSSKSPQLLKILSKHLPKYRSNFR